MRTSLGYPSCGVISTGSCLFISGAFVTQTTHGSVPSNAAHCDWQVSHRCRVFTRKLSCHSPRSECATANNPQVRGGESLFADGHNRADPRLQHGGIRDDGYTDTNYCIFRFQHEIMTTLAGGDKWVRLHARTLMANPSLGRLNPKTSVC